MFKILKTYILSLFLLIILNGCGKEYTCSHSYYYVHEGIAFVGFSSAELNQVVVNRYRKGGSFSELISTDTIDASDAVFASDTAYRSASNYSFFNVQDDADYKVSVLNANKDYTLVLEKGPDRYTWTQGHHCSPGAYQARIVPYTILLNGQQYQPYAPFTNNYFIYLAK